MAAAAGVAVLAVAAAVIVAVVLRDAGGSGDGGDGDGDGGGGGATAAQTVDLPSCLSRLLEGRRYAEVFQGADNADVGPVKDMPGRDLGLKRSPEFLKYVDEVWKLIEDEVVSAMTATRAEARRERGQ